MTDTELIGLDAFIAEHVMEFDVSKMVRQNDGIYHLVVPVPGNRSLVRFSPTTDPAAAMMVLSTCCEKLQRKQGISISMTASDFCVCVSTDCDYEPNDYSNHIEAKTLPLAISLFAKKLFAK